MADDWTNGQFDDENPDESFVMPKGYADGKTTKQIDTENGFQPMPEGPQVLVIKAFSITSKNDDGHPVEKFRDCWVDGQKHAISNYDVELTLALASNSRCTVREFLQWPPSDPQQAELFAASTPKEDGKQKGFWYNKLRHLVGALGFDTDNGSLPDAAMVPKNLRFWPDGSPRQFVAKIVPQIDQNTNEPKVGKSGDPYMQVALFSCRQSDDTLRRLGKPVPAQASPSPQATAAPTTKANGNGNGSKPAPAPATKPAPAAATAATAGRNLKF